MEKFPHLLACILATCVNTGYVDVVYERCMGLLYPTSVTEAGSCKLAFVGLNDPWLLLQALDMKACCLIA